MTTAATQKPTATSTMKTTKTPTADSTHPTADSDNITFDNDKATFDGVAGKTQTTATTSPTMAELDTLEADAKVLASGAEVQRARVGEIRRLQAEQEAIRAQCAAEEGDFAAASAKLSKLQADLDLLRYTADHRAAKLTAHYGELRQTAADLKSEILGGLNRASGKLREARNGEVASLIRSWGGNAAQTAQLPAAVVAASCSKIQALDAHRQAMEAWMPDHGVAAFLASARPAAAAVAEVGPGPEQPPLYGGFTENSSSRLVGWDGQNRRYDLIAEYENPTAAREAYHKLRNQSGFSGFASLVLFGEARPENGHTFQPGEFMEGTNRQNRAVQERQHTGANAGFFDEVAAWTSAA